MYIEGMLDDLEAWECEQCKNVWFVPYFDIGKLGWPSYCPFCGVEIDHDEVDMFDNIGDFDDM